MVKYGRLLSHAPPAYLWGWREREPVDEELEITEEKVEVEPAWVPWETYVSEYASTTQYKKEGTAPAGKLKPKVVPVLRRKRGTASGTDVHEENPDLQDVPDLTGLDEDIRNELEEMVKESSPNSDYLMRLAKMEAGRKQILDKLRTSRMKDENMLARSAQDEMIRVRLEQEYKIHWEATMQKGAVSEAFLDEFFRGRFIRPGPPPAAPIPRSAFFVFMDCSGSTDGPVWDAETAIAYSFLKEAEGIAKSGRRHYLALYAFQNDMQYPSPNSILPSRGRFNPLPTDALDVLIRDFAYHWPGAGGGTDWSLATPALVDDYMKFGLGDVFIFTDGDIGDEAEMMFQNESSCIAKFGGRVFNFGQYYTHDTPTPLTVIQEHKEERFEKGEPVGKGALFYVLGSQNPDVETARNGFPCPECGAKPVVYVGRTPELGLEGMCPAGHRVVMSENSCPKHFGGSKQCGAGIDCESCLYYFFVLRKLFMGRVFIGATPDEMYADVAKVIDANRVDDFSRGHEWARQEGE